MAAAENQIVLEGTAVPEPREGLPQLDPASFPSQIFWLVVTFGLLFLVLWRIVMPRIHKTIGERRYRIEGDLSSADRLRKDASNALAAYEAELAAARGRALAVIDENRKRVSGEIDSLKAAADADAQAAIIDAELRIAANRVQAQAQVRAAAAEAAAAIVERLIGTSVSLADARQSTALPSVKGG